MEDAEQRGPGIENGETELRKADRTVGMNCNIFPNISSGTA